MRTREEVLSFERSLRVGYMRARGLGAGIEEDPPQFHPDARVAALALLARRRLGDHLVRRNAYALTAIAVARWVGENRSAPAHPEFSDPADQQATVAHLADQIIDNLAHASEHENRLGSTQVQADPAEVAKHQKHSSHHLNAAADAAGELVEALKQVSSKPARFAKAWNDLQAHKDTGGGSVEKSASLPLCRPSRALSGITVMFTPRAWAQLDSYVRADRGLETAGIGAAIARPVSWRTVVIDEISGPGAWARLAPDWHRPDAEHDWRQIERMRAAGDYPIVHWHSDTQSNVRGWPSPEDVEAWQTFMRALDLPFALTGSSRISRRSSVSGIARSSDRLIAGLVEAGNLGFQRRA